MAKWRNFLPDRYLTEGLLLAALIIVVTLCLPAIGHRFGYDDPSTRSFADQFFGSILAVLAGSQLVSKLVIIVFWGSIGFIIYLVTWIGVNAMIELRNEATMDVEYTNRSSLVATLRQPLEHLIAGLGLLVVAIGTIFSLKLWATLGMRGVVGLPAPGAIGYLVAALVGCFGCLYITSVMWRLTHWVASGRRDLDN